MAALTAGEGQLDLPVMAVTMTNIHQAVTWTIDDKILKLVDWNYYRLAEHRWHAPLP